MKDNHFNIEDLKVYRNSLELLIFIYEAPLQFPMAERFMMSSQFQRAALSISLNLSEGTGASNKQNLHYLNIAEKTSKGCVVCTTASFRRK